MPKLHSITIQVEEVAVGYVMRVLNTTPGVAKIKYDMEGFENTPNKKPNGRVPHATAGTIRKSYKSGRGEDFIVKVLTRAGKPMNSGQLKQVFANDGRSPHSIASPVHQLRQQGLIETTPEGYVLTKKMKDRLRHRKEA